MMIKNQNLMNCMPLLINYNEFELKIFLFILFTVFLLKVREYL